jgi:transmembrane sensor
MQVDYQKYSFEEFARDEKFQLWILKKDAESTSFWENWLAQNPHKEKTVHLAKSFLLALQENDNFVSETELEGITEAIIEGDRPIKLSLWRNKVFNIAASIMLLVGLGLVIFYFNKNNNNKEFSFISDTDIYADNFIENTNTTNSIQQITLQDGSVVSLYPKSKIRYPRPFLEKKREIYLKGQAFFKITKNPSKSFWVYTEKIATQVLGTSFMVKAFENMKDVSVEVKSGKVSVYTSRDIEKVKTQNGLLMAGVILTPNQKVSFSKSEERLVKSIVEKPEEIVEVVKEEFRFDEVPMAKVFAILEKTYGITVIYDTKTMEGCFLTANLEEESLYEKLNIISKITHSTYEIVDAQIIIYSKGCN